MRRELLKDRHGAPRTGILGRQVYPIANVLLRLIAPILGVSSGTDLVLLQCFWVGCRVTCSRWWFTSVSKHSKTAACNLNSTLLPVR